MAAGGRAHPGLAGSGHSQPLSDRDRSRRLGVRQATCDERPEEPSQDAPAARAGGTQWLGFAGLLDSELVPPHPHGERLAQYAGHMRAERALVEATIAGRQRRAEEFLARHCPREDSLRALSARDLDAAIACKAGADGCSRVTLRVYQYDLRYAGALGWCDRQLAESIRPAPAYQLESLPAGPAWPDVERLLYEMDGAGAANALARAVLLLCAVYGVRSGEIRRLRLADLDWERDTILFRSSKLAGQYWFPLQRSVGDAIIRYLREERPRRAACPEVFLTLRAPVRPLTRGVVYSIVSQQLRRSQSPLRHRAARMPCATPMPRGCCSRAST